MENRLNVKTHVRIPKELYAKIKRMAETNERSVNGEIVHLLRLSADIYTLDPLAAYREANG